MSYDWSDVDKPVIDHAFDRNQNGWSLHQINLTLSKSFPEGIAATINGIFGDDAAVLSPTGQDFDLTQGYFTWNTGNFTLMGGRFVTLAGFETINPSTNWNASRGLLFNWMQPLFHTGARGIFRFGDTMAVRFGLNNGALSGTRTGANNTKIDNNTSQTVEAQFAFTPSPALSATITGYSGKEDPQPAGGKYRTDLIDAVVSAGITDAIWVAVNADYRAVKQSPLLGSGTIVQKGIAGYLNFKFGQFRVSPRVEYLEFDTGFAADPMDWEREVTLTGAFAPSENLEFMAEIRNDQLDIGAFGNSYSPRDVNALPNNDQYTGTLKAVFKF